jgi:hypothetical protein
MKLIKFRGLKIPRNLYDTLFSKGLVAEEGGEALSCIGQLLLP